MVSKVWWMEQTRIYSCCFPFYKTSPADGPLHTVSLLLARLSPQLQLEKEPLIPGVMPSGVSLDRPRQPHAPPPHLPGGLCTLRGTYFFALSVKQEGIFQTPSREHCMKVDDTVQTEVSLLAPCTQMSGYQHTRTDLAPPMDHEWVRQRWDVQVAM